MSALLSLGEANHAILNADAEIQAVAMHGCGATLARARERLAEARASLGAVRFVLRTQALADALDYHETMAIRAREAARLARMVPGRGMYLQASQHEAFAKALRVLIGTTEGIGAESSELRTESRKGGVG